MKLNVGHRLEDDEFWWFVKGVEGRKREGRGRGFIYGLQAFGGGWDERMGGIKDSTRRTMRFQRGT